MWPQINASWRHAKSLSKSSSVQLWLIAVPLHLFLLGAIFDVYYRSPVIHGLEGTQGLGVPPGHVALLAGMREDVSAVAKGWSVNPVEFDHVINRSSAAFAWGSPDIVPLFSRGISDGKLRTFSYDAQMEDFFGAEPYKLDEWVFSRVLAFLSTNSTPAHGQNDTLALQNDKLVLFLHLLGLDTAGHGYKPHSEEYLKCIQNVDKGVEMVVNAVRNFYNETESSPSTLFIFTADHGMTDWGSHGAGTEHETFTPVVAWGAGVSNGNVGSVPRERKINFEKQGWWLNEESRSDLLQVGGVDLAILMSALLGTTLPTNSFGTLPTSYMGATSVRYKFHAAVANYRLARQQYEAVREIWRKRTFSVIFRDFEPLAEGDRLTAIDRDLEGLKSQRRFEAGTRVALQAVPILHNGTDYFHRYNRHFQTTCIAATFISWSILLCAVAVRPKRFRHLAGALFKPTKFGSVFIGLAVGVLGIMGSDWLDYVYCVSPMLLFGAAMKVFAPEKWPTNLSISWPEAKHHLAETLKDASLLQRSLLAICAPFVLALTFQHRWVLSAILAILSLWPIWDSQLAKCDWQIKSAWSMSCLICTPFAFLPTVGQSPIFYINAIITGFIALVALIIYLCLFAVYQLDFDSGKLSLDDGHKYERILKISGRNGLISWPLLVFAISTASLVCLLWTEYSLSSRRGLPFLCQIYAWLSLLAPFIPLFLDTRVVQRCAAIVVAFYWPYCILSISYETAFYACFSCLLASWYIVEISLAAQVTSFSELFNMIMLADFSPKLGSVPEIDGVVKLRGTTWVDWRRAMMLVFLYLLAFFGTGNIASLNSFNPSFVRCFVTVFQPWLMGLLLFVKLVVPLFLVSTAHQAISADRDRRVSTAFLPLVMYLADCMAMVCFGVYFFRLRDTGSWLEIGTSISHYILAMSLAILAVILKSATWHYARLEVSVLSARGNVVKFPLL